VCGVAVIETDKRKVALMQLVEDEKLYCSLLTSLVDVRALISSSSSSS
jgi:hypothetical protein